MSYGRAVTVRVAHNRGVDPSFEGFTEELYLPSSLQDYAELWRSIERWKQRDFATWKALMRLWSAADQYFLLMFILRVGRDARDSYRGEPHFWHESHLRMARSVQFDTGMRLYVCSRRFGKSTHITHTNNIHRKLLDPRDCTCIFSLTRELAKDHLSAIQKELKENQLLVEVWNDRFYRDPEHSGVPFSLDDGIRVKRSSTRPEESFEARSFTARLPTGMGYDRRFYDDIEADSTVASEVAMETAEDRFISSQDLRSDDGDDIVLGTIYHQAGLLQKVHKTYNRRLIVYAGEDLSPGAKEGLSPEEAGPMGGRPSHGFTRRKLFDLWYSKGCDKKSSARISYGRQIACDPLSGEVSRLPLHLINYYDEDPRETAYGMSVYVCLDPSPGTTQDGRIVARGDPSFCWVWMLRPDHTYVWIDGWRRRLAPHARMEAVLQTVLKWQQMGADVVAVRIEQYAAAEYVQQQMAYNHDRGLSIPVERCSEVGKVKRDREHERWDQILSDGAWFPRQMFRDDGEGGVVDLVDHMVNHEMADFPQPATDDGLDAGGLILEPVSSEVAPLVWPAGLRRLPYRETEMDDLPESFMEGGIV